MSNYTKTTNFSTKDALPSGNPAKIVKGTEIDTEFNNIATAVATKSNSASPTFTGTLTAPVVTASTSLNIAGDGATVTGIKDEDDMASNSATKLATQQSIKAYVDSQVTAQDLDVTDGTTSISIDLDSEALSLLGGTGIDSTASGNSVTMAIDSTVATLTGTQTLTNKTLTSPDVNTPDIDGGTIDGTVIGGTTAAAGSFTTVGATGNITVGGTVDGRDVATDGTKLDGIEAGATADQTAAEIKTAYESNANTNAFTDADESKLDGIEAGADVTDTANVTAAGALMDSELTNITAVKALNQGVATTDSPSFVGLTASGEITANGGIALGDNDKATFGASDDLQIYHDGSNSYVDEQGTGILKLRGSAGIELEKYDSTEQMLTAYHDDAVTLFYNGSSKLATTATGIDVTGTATMDGLTVTGTLGNFAVDTQGAIAAFSRPSTSYIRASDVSGSLRFDTGGSIARLNIASNGDISFYEDTGTTPKFFWDASAESLGIGKNSLSYTATNRSNVEIKGASSALLALQSGNENSYLFKNGTTLNIHNQSSGPITFDTAATERMRIDSSGNVGIGTDSPSKRLEILDSTASPSSYIQGIRLTGNAGNYYDIGRVAGTGELTVSGNQSGVPLMTWVQNATERMRIDSSGNLGIGTPTNRLGEKLHVLGNGIVTSSAENTNMGMFGTFGGSELIVGAFNNIPVVFRQNNTERMRIDSSGNVGIGVTPNASARLHIGKSGGSPELWLERTDGYLPTKLIGNTLGNGQGFKINVAGTDSLAIDSSGNVGIGNTSPYSPLSVTTTGTLPQDKFWYDQVNMLTLNGTRPRAGLSTAATAGGNAYDGDMLFYNMYYDGGADYQWKERMRIDSSGNVILAAGTGTLQTATAGTSNFRAGVNAGNSIIAGGNYNTVVGDEAGTAITTGDRNTATGFESLKANNTGSENVSMGYQSLDANTTGNSNTAIGDSSLSSNTTASGNTAIGKSALLTNTTGSSNIAVGQNALRLNTTASNNTAVGLSALKANTTGNRNTASGFESLKLNTTGLSNVSIGAYSSNNNTTASYNVVVGDAAFFINTTGANSVAVGYEALKANTTASNNTAVGYRSLLANTTGVGNTAVGSFAGDSITTGNSNTIIGSGADAFSATASGNIVLGYNTIGVQAGDGGTANIMTIGSSNGSDRVYNEYDANATWTRVSDVRYKEEIQDNNECGLDFINDLRPVTFKWKPKSKIPTTFPDYDATATTRTKDKKMYGLIAQEVKASLDKHNITDFGGWDQMGNGVQAVGQSMFVYPLIKAIQELSAQVEELTARIETLEG